MSELPGNPAIAAGLSEAAAFVAFMVAGERLALPMHAVEAVMPPPPLALLPCAEPGLLGIGNFAGRILPVVDLARLLGRRQIGRAYNGGGEVMLLRAPDGAVGLWVDRVERLLQADSGVSVPGGHTILDPTPMLAGLLEPREAAAGAPAPLGNVAELAPPEEVATAAETVILFEAAGRPFWLPREAVAELVETVAFTPVPRAPAGLLGVAVLRGAALPVLSVAALAELPDRGPGGFVLTEFERRGALLAVDRIVGLRPAAVGERIDIAAILSPALRHIVLGFPPVDAGDASAPAAGDAGQYLAFSLGGQDFAVPAAEVERIVAAPRLAALPRPSAETAITASPIIGIIELSGQIVPVAALRPRLSPSDGSELRARPESVYVVLRSPEGLTAIGVDAVKQVVSLAPDNIARRAAGSLIEAIATTADGMVLRLISTRQLWGAP